MDTETRGQRAVHITLVKFDVLDEVTSWVSESALDNNCPRRSTTSVLSGTFPPRNNLLKGTGWRSPAGNLVRRDMLTQMATAYLGGKNARTPSRRRCTQKPERLAAVADPGRATLRLYWTIPTDWRKSRVPRAFRSSWRCGPR